MVHSYIPEDHSGCKFLGIGSPCQQHNGTGGMVLKESMSFIESERASSGSESLAGISDGNKGSQSPDSIRQYRYCCVPQQTGSYEELDTSVYRPGDFIMGRRESSLNYSSAPGGDTKQPGRLSQPLPGMLRQLVPDRWGCLKADLFADQNNRKTEKFFSLNPAYQSLGVDALANPLLFVLRYAFLPIRLIPEVLRKFLLEKKDFILIAPFGPKRPWFSLLQTQSLHFVL